MHVGLVGAGFWGKNHIRVLYSLGVLRRVCDTNAAALTEMSREYSGLSTTTNFDELLDDASLTAIFIVSSAATHYKLGKKALLAGKDVFVEKPLALLASEGEELVKLAEQQKKILMVGHILHYHPAIKILKTLVQRGDLGELRYISSHRLNFGKFRTEENVLWSFGPHDISLILDFYKDVPEKISVQGAAYLQKNIPDTTISFLQFPGNRKAHVFVSWLYPFKEQRFVLIGDKNMAVFDDQAQEKLVIYQNEVSWEHGKPMSRKNGEIIFRIPESEPLKEEDHYFLHCLDTREKPLTDGEEGLRVLRVLESCQQQLTPS